MRMDIINKYRSNCSNCFFDVVSRDVNLFLNFFIYITFLLDQFILYIYIINYAEKTSPLEYFYDIKNNIDIYILKKNAFRKLLFKN